jgi:hypothetical protein
MTGSVGTGSRQENASKQEAKRERAFTTDGYFSEVLIEVNLVFRLLPTPLTAVMIAIAIPAAINPYSIAVAPDSSARKFLNTRSIAVTSSLRTGIYRRITRK